MKIYVTFGQDHTHRVNGVTWDKDIVAEIDCETHGQGREEAFNLFGDKFCFTLDKQPDMSFFPRGICNVASENRAGKGMDKTLSQKEEFDAMDTLANEWSRLRMTPIVDDDYEEVRNGYERALATFIGALKANKRIKDPTEKAMPIIHETISRINKERALVWHKNGLQEWSPAEWGNALAGEAGELCNLLKKILRHDCGIQQAEGEPRACYVTKAKKEIGDVYLYLDLICQVLGLDLYDCVQTAFNKTSKKEGFAHRLPE